VCSEADFRKKYFLQIFLQFLSFQCEATGLSLLASGRLRLKRPDGKVTRPGRAWLIACLCRNACPDWLVSRPDRDPTGFKKTLAAASLSIPHSFFLKFCLLVDFLVG